MISTVKSLLGCQVFAAILGVSSLAQAAPPSSSTDSSSLDTRPEELPYEEGQRIPSGYKVDERIRLGLVIPGSILFGLSWGAAILVGIGRGATSENGGGSGAAFFPVIGPFVAASKDGSFVAFNLVDGIIQTGSLAMLLGGILAPKKVLVRQDVATIKRPEILVGPGSIGMKFSF